MKRGKWPWDGSLMGEDDSMLWGRQNPCLWFSRETPAQTRISAGALRLGSLHHFRSCRLVTEPNTSTSAKVTPFTAFFQIRDIMISSRSTVMAVVIIFVAFNLTNNTLPLPYVCQNLKEDPGRERSSWSSPICFISTQVTAEMYEVPRTSAKYIYWKNFFSKFIFLQ